MMASTLLANHARVYVVDLDEHKTRDIATRYSQLASESGSRGAMVGIQGDCGSKAGAERIVAALSDKEEYVTCLFNNAGVMGDKVDKPKAATAEAFKEAYFKLADDSFQRCVHGSRPS